MKYLIILFVLLSCSNKDKISERIPEVDLLIKNAIIYDADRANPEKSNVYIYKDKIVFIGDADHTDLKINKQIDASGYILSPGFIDLHAHGIPTKSPDFDNFLAMGVTTIALGQDGFSPQMEDLSEWIRKVDSIKTGTNIAMFIGHSTLRNLAGIGNREKITVSELSKMKRILKKNLDHTFGMTTGLEYSPAIYAEKSELIELAKVVGNNKRMIMSHMRNEDDNEIINSLNELIAQGEYTRVHAAHLKSVYGKGENRAEDILKVFYKAIDNGIKLSADVYPYTASYTGISIVFPKWAKTRKQFDKIKKSRRTELENFIRTKVNKRNGPEATLLGTDPYLGKTLKDLQDEMKKPFEKILIDDIGPGGASAAYFVMDEALQSRLIKDSNIGISSDGSPTMHHPRGYGSFAKIFEEFVVQDSILTLSEAINKMTYFPAKILGLTDRGLIKVGHKADIILFKADQVKANATFPKPHQLASGFEYVIVNGELIIEKGKRLKLNTGGVILP